jgi:heme exporter protein CcmD
MTHLPFIAAAYGLTLLVVGWLSVDCWQRMRRAKAQLSKIDPRGQR